ncbi:MAG: family 16 glycosylhydrolase [Thermoguttaceae bacterium]
MIHFNTIKRNLLAVLSLIFFLTASIGFLTAPIGANEVQSESTKNEKNSENAKNEKTIKAFPIPDVIKGNWVFYPEMSDEFNDDSLDSKKWHPNNPTWMGREPGYFSKDNVSVKNGMLQLTAKAENLPNLPAGYHTYTTAAVQSKERVLYGFFEIRAKPMNSAASSAFWFYESEEKWWTEIDVFELSGKKSKENDNRYHMNLHVFKTPERGNKHTSEGTYWDAPFRFADDFHVYSLEWDNESIKWYVDNQLVRTSPNTEWHQALTLNFDSETMPEWFGLPDVNDLPSTFYIDYVRCWKKQDDPQIRNK